MPVPFAAGSLMAAFLLVGFHNQGSIYHQSVLEIINLFIYHSVLLIGLLSWSSGKLLLRLACSTGETDVHTAARPDY
jgi:hypothetical protein